MSNTTTAIEHQHISRSSSPSLRCWYLWRRFIQTPDEHDPFPITHKYVAVELEAFLWQEWYDVQMRMHFRKLYTFSRSPFALWYCIRCSQCFSGAGRAPGWKSLPPALRTVQIVHFEPTDTAQEIQLQYSRLPAAYSTLKGFYHRMVSFFSGGTLLYYH